MRISGVTIPVEAAAVQALVEEIHRLARQAPLPADMLAAVDRLGPELVTVDTHTRPLRIVAEPTPALHAIVDRARATVEGRA